MEGLFSYKCEHKYYAEGMLILQFQFCDGVANWKAMGLNFFFFKSQG